MALKTLETELTDLTGITPEQALGRLPNHKQLPAVRCALECALLDLISQREAAPLHRWLNPESSSRVRVNANIGALDDGSIDQATAAIKRGYTTLKLKVGISDVPGEIKQLRLLCSELPESIQLRLDANRAWDAKTARAFLQGIGELPVESLEEPLAEPDLQTLAQLQGETDVALALDETVAELDKHSWSQLHPLRRIILKPVVLGGVLPSLQLGRCAQELGIEVVVTTTVDSAAGVWAATQLAAAVDPTGQLCHGLGTSAWLQRDLGAGPEIQNGTITIPPTPGLGFLPYA
jgi:o-succinylbenzoate synthase